MTGPRTSGDFEQVALQLLADHGLPDAHVRLLTDPWQRRPGVRCHVYAGSTALRHPAPRWSWASPDVQTPQELAEALESALQMRRLERAPRLLPDLGEP